MVLTAHINPPALYFTSSKSLIIADLGLGIVASNTGIAESIFQVCLKDLIMLANKVEAKRLVINGDFKESIGKPSQYELELIRRFEKLTEKLFDEVILVKGNHDGSITDYVGFRVVSSHSFIEDGV